MAYGEVGMSVGHHHGEDDAPAGAGTVVRLLRDNPGLRNHLAPLQDFLGWGLIDRRYRVPYLAGSSSDGRTVYIDAQTPNVLPKSKIEPDRFYAAHEMTEWWLMTRLGMQYFPAAGPSAHRLAHGVERYFMMLDGISDERIEEYEAESLALVNIDEKLKLPPEAYPPDLYLGPYEARGDSDRKEDELDRRLLPLLRQAQMLGRPRATA